MVAASTWEGKSAIFHGKIEPYLGSTPIEELSMPDALLWQDFMRLMRKKDGNRYSPTYLRDITTNSKPS